MTGPTPVPSPAPEDERETLAKLFGGHISIEYDKDSARCICGTLLWSAEHGFAAGELLLIAGVSIASTAHAHHLVDVLRGRPIPASDDRALNERTAGQMEPDRAVHPRIRPAKYPQRGYGPKFSAFKERALRNPEVRATYEASKLFGDYAMDHFGEDDEHLGKCVLLSDVGPALAAHDAALRARVAGEIAERLDDCADTTAAHYPRLIDAYRIAASIARAAGEGAKS